LCDILLDKERQGEMGKMIKNIGLKKFEMEWLRKEKVDVMRNFRIIEALYKEAVALGTIPLKTPLDGLDVDIKIARVINSVSKVN
jgi:hypothetical protein